MAALLAVTGSFATVFAQNETEPEEEPVLTAFGDVAAAERIAKIVLDADFIRKDAADGFSAIQTILKSSKFPTVGSLELDAVITTSFFDVKDYDLRSNGYFLRARNNLGEPSDLQEWTLAYSNFDEYLAFGHDLSFGPEVNKTLMEAEQEMVETRNSHGMAEFSLLAEAEQENLGGGPDGITTWSGVTSIFKGADSETFLAPQSPDEKVEKVCDFTAAHIEYQNFFVGLPSAPEPEDDDPEGMNLELIIWTDVNKLPSPMPALDDEDFWLSFIADNAIYAEIELDTDGHPLVFTGGPPGEAYDAVLNLEVGEFMSHVEMELAKVGGFNKGVRPLDDVDFAYMTCEEKPTTAPTSGGFSYHTKILWAFICSGIAFYFHAF